MDHKVWKYIVVYYQKSSERVTLQSSMTLVITVSTAILNVDFGLV